MGETYSDEAGDFSFRMPEGIYELRARLAGYETKVVSDLDLRREGPRGD